MSEETLKEDTCCPKNPFPFPSSIPCESSPPRPVFLCLLFPFEQTASLSLFLPMKNQIQSSVENVQRQFNGLREFLDSKENGELHRLKEEKEEVVKRLGESENELVQQRQWVRDLISDVEHQLELSTMEMLQVRLQEDPVSESQETGNHCPPSLLLLSSWW
jgi:hypothetical protein